MAKHKGSPPVGYKQRKVGTREKRQTFLIVCEGTKTEPNYFNGFRSPTVHVKTIGQGANPRKLVEVAEARRKEDDYDQVWCVFDRDEWSHDDFNGAIKHPKSLDIQVAYSNEAFELWYLLHFELITTTVPRKEYGSRLTKAMHEAYEKNSQQMYQKILTQQPQALERAEKLLNSYEKVDPWHNNPSTTVHCLVMQLNRFTRR